MKFSRLFLISLLSVLTLVLVQLPGSTFGWTGNPIVATSLTGTPIVATTPIMGSTFKVVASPNKPNTLASYIFEFQVPNELVNGVDEIIITWGENFLAQSGPQLFGPDFPNVIANSAVSVRAVLGDGSGCGTAPVGNPITDCGVTNQGNQGLSVAPEEVNITFVNPFDGDLEVQTKLRIPDMDSDVSNGGTGIRANATVTVVFHQAAGISNPSESRSHNLHVRVTNNGVDAGFSEAVRRGIFIPTHMLPSNNDGKRGESRTLFASGIEGNESITFFRDANGNGVREVIEPVLCTIVAVREGNATCTFTISSPPFVRGKFEDVDSGADLAAPVIGGDSIVTVDDGGKFEPGQSIILNAAETVTIAAIAGNDLTLTANTIGAHAAGTDVKIVGSCAVGSMGGCNFINFLDSEGRNTTGEFAAALDQEAVNRQVLFLDQTVIASPEAANVGKTLAISLFDWPTGLITKITLGGVEIALPSPVPATSASGEVSFDLTIPGVGSGADAGVPIPTGKIPLKVFIPGATEDTNITIKK